MLYIWLLDCYNNLKSKLKTLVQCCLKYVWIQQNLESHFDMQASNDVGIPDYIWDGYLRTWPDMNASFGGKACIFKAKGQAWKGNDANPSIEEDHPI